MLKKKPERFRALVEMYLEDFENFDARVASLFADENFTEMKNLIHSLRGSSSNLGMNQLYWITSSIEKKFQLEEEISSDVIEQLQIVYRATVQEAQSLVLRR